jgi:hypothetical protein
LNKTIEQNESKSQEMKTGQGFRQAFIVAGQAAEAVEPAKTALDDPAAREQNEATFGIWQFDDFKLNAVLGKLVARVRMQLAGARGANQALGNSDFLQGVS